MLSPSPLTEAKFKFDRHVVPILRLHILGAIVNSSSSLHRLVGVFCQSTVGRRRLRSECMSCCREPKDCELVREDYLGCLHHSKEVDLGVAVVVIVAGVVASLL
ncbi:hypothetical protein AHAS_Ahas18G0179300 [Arachis hypogaea]